MERRQLTTHEVAEVVGLRDQAVYYWLTNRTAPKDDAAGKLAEVLGVPEIEVRRRFGLWVPDESEPAARDDDEIDAALKVMRAAIEELERIKRDRNAS
jgi:transcriptional regulator with XRE-family HTH domain